MSDRTWAPSGIRDADPSLPYATHDGIARFLSTRETDGDRPRIYSDWIGKREKAGGAVIGLGCADSAVEAAVCGAMNPPPTRYIGVDVAEDAGTMSQPRFAECLTNFTCVQDDWRNSASVEEVAKAADRRHRVTVMAGRTFGNAPTPAMLADLRLIAASGSIYVDFFAALDPQAELQFAARMQTVAENSSGFLLAPLREAGAIAADASTTLQLVDEGHALRADFLVPGEGGEPRAYLWRAFAIRMFRIEPLGDLLAAHNVTMRDRLDMPEQVLPMTMLQLQFR